MADYEIGYGKPPKSARFKSGMSGNPKGRPKRKSPPLSEIIGGVLNAAMPYREQGRTRTAARLEVNLRILIGRAVKGNVHAAELVLRNRAHAQRHGDAGVELIEIADWLPDHDGQTGDQKTRDFTAGQVADSADEMANDNSDLKERFADRPKQAE